MLVVFGSLMMDIRMQVDALPIPNEKLIAQNHETSVGGQGLNQAIAAIRAGAKVAIIAFQNPTAQQDCKPQFKVQKVFIPHLIYPPTTP
jgi:hypothetical protein